MNCKIEAYLADEDYWTQAAETHNQKVKEHFESETQSADDSGEWRYTTASEQRLQYVEENQKKFAMLQSQYDAKPFEFAFIQPFLQPMPKDEVDQIIRAYFFQASYEVFGSGMLSSAGLSCCDRQLFKLAKICGCCC